MLGKNRALPTPLNILRNRLPTFQEREKLDSHCREENLLAGEFVAAISPARGAPALPPLDPGRPRELERAASSPDSPVAPANEPDATASKLRAWHESADSLEAERHGDSAEKPSTRVWQSRLGSRQRACGRAGREQQRQAADRRTDRQSC